MDLGGGRDCDARPRDGVTAVDGSGATDPVPPGGWTREPGLPAAGSPGEYDFEHNYDITPEEVWTEAQKQNALAAFVRYGFPRTSRHPLVALVVCIDGRLDTNELMGDTRKYYYVLRTAGSVLSEHEEEMLELAVENGVKLVVWTTHTDCAAENAASTEAKRERYPALAKAVDERETRFAEFLGRPAIAARIPQGQLAVKRVKIDTMTGRIQVQ